MRRALCQFIGRTMVKLQALADLQRQEQRAASLAAACEADDGVAFGAGARLLNSTDEPSRIRIGAQTAIEGQLIVFPQGGSITVGRKCYIGEGARIWSAASIQIGDHVLIAHGVNIHDNTSHSQSWAERRAEVDLRLPDWGLHAHDFDIGARPIVIEDDVWIGFGASVLAGVRIGRGAILGAGAIVTKDVPAFAVVVGSPMRIMEQKPPSSRRNPAG